MLKSHEGFMILEVTFGGCEVESRFEMRPPLLPPFHVCVYPPIHSSSPLGSLFKYLDVFMSFPFSSELYWKKI